MSEESDDVCAVVIMPHLKFAVREINLLFFVLLHRFFDRYIDS